MNAQHKNVLYKATGVALDNIVMQLQAAWRLTGVVKQSRAEPLKSIRTKTDCDENGAKAPPIAALSMWRFVSASSGAEDSQP